jgi:MinD superfamily P-loop ATPase
MKIEFEIDDKYEDTNLHLFWGMVPIVRRRFKTGYWEIKTQDCSNCGECCKQVKTNFFTGKEGCPYLKNNMCELGYFRPTGCSIADASEKIESCTVRWSRYK